MSASYFPLDLGPTLHKLRTRADLKQSEVAKNLKIDASRISRIESGDFSPSLEEIEGYLTALGTSEAVDYLNYVRQDWRETTRPSFWHPDREALWHAETLLQRINEFRAVPDVPRPLQGQAELYFDTVKRASDYLTSLVHTIAYIGEIGVGKTTFLSRQTQLMLPQTGKLDLQNRVVLEAGPGRTTICEVRIRHGSNYGIQIEALDDTEIYKLVTEFCKGIKTPRMDATSEDQEMGVPEEIGRAIRNMAELTRRSERDADGKRKKVDPAAELAEQFESLEDFRVEVSRRLKLWKRLSREESWSPATNKQPLEWLKEMFAGINNGRNSDFSLPKRIQIIVREDLLSAPVYELEIVDTKGVDRIAIRPDLQLFADDSRTITVLCSRFNTAPDMPLQGFLKHLIEVGQDRALDEKRVVLLVLPRPGEAMSVKDDAGTVAETADDGYMIKQDQVEAALKNIGVPNLSLYFSNVSEDDPSSFSQALIDQINNMRLAQAKRIANTALAFDQLIVNQEEEHAQLAQSDVTKALTNFIRDHQQIPEQPNPIHRTLLRMIRESHPRTVWASVRRNGNWNNLNMYYYLGAGGAADARRRTEQVFTELTGVIKNKLADTDLEPAHAFLRTLLENIPIWRTAFLETVRHMAEFTFRPSLESDAELWFDCEDKYGRGFAYRQVVANAVEEWFNQADAQPLHLAFEERVQKAWQQEFLAQFDNVARQTVEVGAAIDNE